MEMAGLTEICGRKGDGRTNFALTHSCAHATVYVSTTQFPIRRYAEIRSHSAHEKALFVSVLHSVSDLWFVVKHKLDDFVAANQIELVVIDSLDHLLHAEDKNKRLYAMVVEIVRILKNLVKKHELSVIVLNSWNKGSLGLSWSYFVNTRLLIKRTRNERICECLISVTGDRPQRRFVITEKGVEFC